MKNLLAFLFVFLFLTTGSAQGSIIGFTMSPTSPTATDTVYIYADIRFTSSSCELANQSHAPGGSGIQASAHHCIGIATAICSIIDTFKLDPMPNGNYNFNLNLTSGAAPAPCTAGIGADDDSTFNFTIGPGSPAGVPNHKSSEIVIYPNPIINTINLSAVPNGTAFEIISVSGQVAKSGYVQNETIENLEDLPTGVYFLKLETAVGPIVRRIAKQ